MSYDELRQFADSWGLVLMGVSYLTFVGWHFLPRGRERSDEAARAIFEQEEADHG
ncbi:cbb3-type cytochrome c oxidase subunit 3 [Sphingobium sp. Sx8-8]|uniref:cbb3-type cytochrome oxidase subunit 3 n=1 Tax=Sphingobium sp. Sx8-8 TaxID=2933617 RepID=UPI001F59C3B4|nr:cbb3-type cytochrome c oxidase subunit 3 [Sphingobium sp. Sx8-8]